MIQGDDDYYVATDGTRYEVGDVVPILRLNDIVLFNEQIVKGTCDLCDWAIIGPAALVQAYSHSHVETHMMQQMADELRDEFRHPDFKE